MSSPNTGQLHGLEHDTSEELVDISVRAFGSALEDLAVDFSQASKANIITEVLSGCCFSNSTDDFWSLTLSRRLQLLLQIVVTTQGEHHTVTALCDNHTCREKIELPLNLSLFYDADLSDRVSLIVNNSKVNIRLPNGYDQQALQKNEIDTIHELVHRLLVDIDGHAPKQEEVFDDAWLEKVGEQLESYDKYGIVEINSECPACGTAFNPVLDMESELLGILSTIQSQLLIDIHCLARAYGWSEQEIVAIPAARRSRYLNILRNAQALEGGL